MGVPWPTGVLIFAVPVSESWRVNGENPREVRGHPFLPTGKPYAGLRAETSRL
jgi:hypothetical protein